MEFTSFRFVFIQPDYLEELHNADSEIFYSKDTDYSKKPHLGILTTCNGRKYVIPLSSAKEKHKTWKNVNKECYLIYEYVKKSCMGENDTRTAVIDPYDVIVEETDLNKLRQKGIPENEFQFFKKRILSVLEIKKMFPVIAGVYHLADLSTPATTVEDEQKPYDKRIFLL
mgnify:CR=1 FL=1